MQVWQIWGRYIHSFIANTIPIIGSYFAFAQFVFAFAEKDFAFAKNKNAFAYGLKHDEAYKKKNEAVSK